MHKNSRVKSDNDLISVSLIPSHESLTPSHQPLRSLRLRPVLPRIDVSEKRDFERDDGLHRFF